MENKSKLTLIVDGNWFTMSRVAPMMDEFLSEFDDGHKQRSQEELLRRMQWSLVNILDKLPCVDNIILVSDKSSWRKALVKPAIAPEYKGNRVKDDKYDWVAIFNTLETLKGRLRDNGFTVTDASQTEGDDWCWFWSDYLNSHGQNAVIWSTDRDLQQLVKYNADTCAFTAWYNDANGLVIDEGSQIDTMELFIDCTCNANYNMLSSLMHEVKKVTYINPDEIAICKVMCGDTSDNITPLLTYTTAKGRTMNFTELKWHSTGLHYNTFNEFAADFDNIFKHIVRVKGFDKHFYDYKSVKAMFDYNCKLVRLSRGYINEDIIAGMTQCESQYKDGDINIIRETANQEEVKELDTLFDAFNEI